MGNRPSATKSLRYTSEWHSIQSRPFPINSLPSELISDILLLCGDAIGLITVCHLWRRICVSLPRFWTDIVIRDHSHLDVFAFALNQGNNLPFSLTIHFTKAESNASGSICDHASGLCMWAGLCLRVFSDSEIDFIISVARPHFRRVWSLHLDYQPGHANFEDPEWASSILERFNFPAPTVEIITIESFHEESIYSGFLKGKTPKLVTLRLFGQSTWVTEDDDSEDLDNDYIPDKDDYFVQGKFALQTLELHSDTNIPHEHILDLLRYHSGSLHSLNISLPNRSDLTLEHDEPYRTITMPKLDSIIVQGFYFIVGPTRSPVLRAVDASITYFDHLDPGHGSIVIKSYKDGLHTLFNFLSMHSRHIANLSIHFGHFRLTGISRSSTITMPHLHFGHLTSLTMRTNAPIAVLVGNIHARFLQSLDYTILKPEAISFQLLVPFIGQSRRTLRSLRIRSDRAAPYSMDLQDVRMPHMLALTSLDIEAPKASIFAMMFGPFALTLMPNNIHVVDL